MNMDYSAMWSVVDAHRRCADELEQTLREITGDRPVPENDRVDSYDYVITVLREARDELYRMADREHQSVRNQDAARCRAHARWCDRVIQKLISNGEL